MRYKWKPSKSQKREFAERMTTDTAYSEAYHQRKEQRAKTRRSTSKFEVLYEIARILDVEVKDLLIEQKDKK